MPPPAISRRRPSVFGLYVRPSVGVSVYDHVLKVCVKTISYKIRFCQFRHIYSIGAVFDSDDLITF